jgi:hypothetical protein
MLELIDFRMAGYLVARGQSLKGTVTNTKGGVVFQFDKSADALLHEYPGSPEQRYDAACKSMHDFVRMRRANKTSGR